MNKSAALTLIAVSSALLPVAGYAECDVRSGPRTAALIELYTSEGCSSCPPADRQLSDLKQALAAKAVAVPLALHVGYWDYIGWKDPYAQAAFGERQTRLASINRSNAVYTPEFFVNGAELRWWRGGLRETVRSINARPARASIRVRARVAPTGTLALHAEAEADQGSEPAALYVALAESGLSSKVTRGENSGATLSHDHVVRRWIGPVRLTDGAARVRREIPLPAAWSRARLDVVAFVQDERSGSVLQAVSAHQCAAS